MRDALPGDIYVDESGKLWRVRAVSENPTVLVEEVEQDEVPTIVATRKATRYGAVQAYVWQRWRRIWRPGEPS